MYPSISADDYRVIGNPVTGFDDEDFFFFCQRNPDLRIERTANHEIIIMPPAGGESSITSGDVYFHLKLWSRQHGGQTFDSSVGFRLPDGAILSPDTSWVNAAAWSQLTAEQRKKFPPLCPDFVIEVKSPSDRIPTLQAKMEQWLNNGVRLGFLIDTETQMAYVYTPGQPVQAVQGFENELSGEPALPSFRLDLRELKV